MSEIKKWRDLFEERKDDDGSLDEVVARDVKTFHLERMSDEGWWMALYLKDGTTYHVNLVGNKGTKVEGWVEKQ